MSLLMVRKSAPAKAADAADAAAQFKVGDKIWVDPSYGANLNIGYGWNVGIVKRVGTGNIDVDFKGQVISVPAPYCARVNSSGKPVFDSAAIDELKGVIGIIHKVASVNEFNRLVDSAKDAADAADAAAQDRGNYATNTIALLRTTLGNIRTAVSVVSRAISNIGAAMDKVKDERAKSSLKSMLQEWLACERELWDVHEEVKRISVPSGIGVPNKQKLSPEDRKFIDEFFE